MSDAIDEFVNTTFFISYVIGAIIYGLVFIGARPTHKFYYEVASNVLFTIGFIALAWQWHTYYNVLKTEHASIAATKTKNP